MAAAAAAGGGGSAAAGSGTRLPNILIAGTPGTGKTTLSAAAAEKLGFKHINIGDLIKTEGFHGSYDPAFDTYSLDDDSIEKLLDFLEPIIAEGGTLVDFHTVDFFPERFFDLVLVLRADNTTLYDRLVGRGYSAKKVEENVTAEIMQVVLEDARESYKEEIVHEVESNTLDDLAAAEARLEAWLAAWKADHGVAEEA